MNIHLEAKDIIQTHTSSMMRSCSYEPKDNDELYEFMTDECAFILTEDFINGKYTPMEYNAIREELACILNGIFLPLIYPEAE